MNNLTVSVNGPGNLLLTPSVEVPFNLLEYLQERLLNEQYTQIDCELINRMNTWIAAKLEELICKKLLVRDPLTGRWITTVDFITDELARYEMSKFSKISKGAK